MRVSDLMARSEGHLMRSYIALPVLYLYCTRTKSERESLKKERRHNFIIV